MKNNFAPNCKQCRELYPQDFIGKQRPLYCLICYDKRKKIIDANKQKAEDP